MSFLKPIIAFSLVAIMIADGTGEDLPIPAAQKFPTDASAVELAETPRAHPEPVMTEPTRSVMTLEPNRSEGELVSILKHRFPKTNEPIQMKDAPEWFQNMMQRIVRENVPDKYVHDKKWGMTDKRWDGLDIQRRGPFRLFTKRKWKEVNHGTWKRYEITQLSPHKNLLMRIENVHDVGNGKVGFEISLASKLHVFGRIAKWTKGVQIYSVSADADADAVIRIWCETGMKVDMRKFPPDVLIVPVVTRAELDVTNFRLQRVSKFDGPVVKQLSKSVHKVLLDKIEEKRDQLPEKINRQIAKHQDKMRLSLSNFASSKWNELTTSVSPSTSVQKITRPSAFPPTQPESARAQR